MNFDHKAKYALMAACVTLLVCGIGFRYAVDSAQAFLAKEPVPLRNPLTSIPKRLRDWEAGGQDVKLTAEIEEALGTRKYLDRAYVRSTGRNRDQTIHVHITYYTGLIDAVPHVPDRCLAAGGWVTVGLPRNIDLSLDRSNWLPDPDHVNLGTDQPYPRLTYSHHVTGRPVTVRMPVGEFKLRTTEFRGGDRLEQRIYAGYFFIANGRTTPWPEGVRTLAFDLTTRYAYFAKIQFTMIAPQGKTPEEFVADVADLANELLPELMWCLPDWAQVESMSTG